MRDRDREREPMCETSEPGERLISRDEILPITLSISQRIMEVFGYQTIPEIVFRLRSTSKEVNAVIDGRALPSTELLLGIHKLTGVSIDWLLTGAGSKYPHGLQIPVPVPEPVPSTPWLNQTHGANDIVLTNGTHQNTMPLG